MTRTITCWKSACQTERGTGGRNHDALNKKIEKFQAVVVLNFAYCTSASGTLGLKPPRLWLLAPRITDGQWPPWLNNVENRQDYIARVQTAVKHLHNCGAQWLQTVPVHEV